MEDMITGLCPQCGHTLHIPAELASFSCMYCGARLTKEQLAAEPPAAQEADEDRAAYYDRAVSRLGWCIKNFGGYQKKIMRDVFFEAFETYETGCAPVIQELARGVAPERQTQLLGRAAAAMLDELEASLKEKGFTFTYDDAVAAYLANKSYSLTYGARNLRRTIQKELEDVIATRIIDSYDHPVTQLRAVMKDGAIDLLSL